MTAQSLDKSKIKFLLLEGIHPSAVDVLRSAGYTQIEAISGALPDEELARRRAAMVLGGVRSASRWASHSVLSSSIQIAVP